VALHKFTDAIQYNIVYNSHWV